MLLAPDKGFVFLAMTKAASTSIEEAFSSYSRLTFSRNPFKHARYVEFQRYLQPFLASQGFPRNSYEVVCVFREPIDWLFSWWRYRSREELANPSHWLHHNYAGHVSFDRFVRSYMKGDEQFARLEYPSGVRRPFEVVRPLLGHVEVDRIFRYNRLDLLVDFLCEKVGKKVEVGIKNGSPERPFSLSQECEHELRAFFEPEYRIYERALGG